MKKTATLSDGTIVKKGDFVQGKSSGTKYKVLCIHGDRLWLIWLDSSNRNRYTTVLDRELVAYKEPDSWEKLKEDLQPARIENCEQMRRVFAGKGNCLGYSCTECKIDVYQGILTRAKKLAGVDDD